MSHFTLDPIVPKSLIDSLKEAFRVQTSTEVEITRTLALDCKSPQERSDGVDLVAAVGIHSSQLTGTVALCLPKATFLGIVNSMLGESYTEITPENADAAGEILNIIYGGARVKMNEAGYDFAPAIPTIAQGNHVLISHSGSPRIVRVDCSTKHGAFHVEFSLRQVSRAVA